MKETQETTVTEILEKELEAQRDYWRKDSNRWRDKYFSVLTRLHKLEMILEFANRYERLPDLAYELMPELQKGAGRVGDPAIREVVSFLPPRGDVEGAAPKEAKES